MARPVMGPESRSGGLSARIQVGVWVRTKTGTRAHYVEKILEDGRLRPLCGTSRPIRPETVVAIDDPMDMECRYCHGECGRRGIRLVQA